MINLFDYATKELSQDAFLRWLFANYENYENQKVRKACYEVLKNFTGFNFDMDSDDSSERITDLESWSQWLKIDIVVAFRFKGKRYYVAIEDKTTSKEHDQLKKYKDSIERHKYSIRNDKEYCVEKIFYVYYKTGQIDKDEKKRILEYQWNSAILSINEISLIFANVKDTGSEILDGYCEYVKQLQISWNNTKMPVSDKHDIIAWYCFFKKIIDNNLIVYPSVNQNNEIIHYGYSAFIVICKEVNESDVPYLEIRSRDCVNKKFVGRILIYGRNIKRGNSKYLKLKEVLSKQENSFFTIQGYREQIAIIERKNIENELEYLEILKQSISNYNDICQEYLKMIK